MKCQDFEGWIVDAARDQEVDEPQRAQALAHAGSCSSCAARLADERSLSSALKQVAAGAVMVPAHIEEALLSAYRAQHAIPPAEEGLRPFRHRRPAYYWGIAAALLVALLGVAAFRMLYYQRRQAPGMAHTSGANNASQSGPHEETQPASETAAVNGLVLSGAEKASPAATESRPKDSAAPKGQVTVEVATDFIAIASDSVLASMESGQLVRVTLPRSALTAYGLPFNRELADKPVSAQVLIGQDGVARAIRFLGDPEVRAIPVGYKSQR